MRNLSANFSTLLARNDATPFFLIRILKTVTTKHDTVVLMETSNAYDINVPGLGNFVATDTIRSIEAPKVSTSVDREPYRVSYNDFTSSKMTLFEDGLSGAKMTAWVGLFNMTNATLGGAAPGEPLVNISDLLIAYEGAIDSQGFTASVKEGSVIAYIEGASPVASLSMVRAYNTSKEFLKRRNSVDVAFDEVHEGSVKISKVWGKA